MAARYPDYIELLAGDAPPPDSNEGYVRVYAASDASLHVLESDGTDTQIGSGGSPGGTYWIGPFTFDSADYSADIGGGNSGILVDQPSPPELPEGAFCLGCAVQVIDSFDNCTVGLDVAVGDPAIDYMPSIGGSARFPFESTPYDTYNNLIQEIGRSGFSSVTNQAITTSGSAPLLLVGGLVAWVTGFDSAPSTGSGRVWFELSVPVAP